MEHLCICSSRGFFLVKVKIYKWSSICERLTYEDSFIGEDDLRLNINPEYGNMIEIQLMPHIPNQSSIVFFDNSKNPNNYTVMGYASKENSLKLSIIKNEEQKGEE
jgi:hypothetical protein